MVLGAIISGAARILPKAAPVIGKGISKVAPAISRFVAGVKGNPALQKVGSGIVTKTGSIAGKTVQAFQQKPIRSVVSVVSGVSAAKAVSGLIAPKPPPVKPQMAIRPTTVATKGVSAGGVATGAVVGAGAVLGGAALAAKNKSTAGKIPVLSNIVNFAQKNPALTAVIGAGAAAAVGGAILATRRKKKKVRAPKRRRAKRGRRLFGRPRRRGRRVTRRVRKARRAGRVSFTTRDGRRVSFTPRARRSTLRFTRKRGRRGTGISKTELRQVKALLRRGERD